MATIETASERQTHEACYRLTGFRANLTLTNGQRVTGKILGSTWKAADERGLRFSVDDAPGTLVVPFSEVYRLQLVG